LLLENSIAQNGLLGSNHATSTCAFSSALDGGSGGPQGKRMRMPDAVRPAGPAGLGL